MIAVDPSAIVALLLGEPGSDEIGAKLGSDRIVISAPGWVELSIVLEARVGAEASALLGELRNRIDMHIVAIDEAMAHEAVSAWRRFGKGRHPAALNFGDCFSYALAQSLGVSLLFVGSDFSQTDLQSA